MGFRILHSSGEEGHVWSELIASLPRKKQDIHFLPEYGSIYQRTYGHEPLLAYFGDERNFVIQPFIRRRLNDLPFLLDQGVIDPCFDIASPYGYGGPICRDEDEAGALSLLADFNAALCEWCQTEGIASEFTSLHPLIGNHELLFRSGIVTLKKEKEVVYVDLDSSTDELWQQLNRGNKSSIHKARKSGIRIAKVPTTTGNLEIFNDLYFATMERQGAAQRWFFPQSYFSNCVQMLGTGRSSLFFAYLEHEVAAAYFLIHEFDTAYYHFGGSDSRHFTLRPNNCLMYEVELWSKGAGYHYYHLGGGVSAAADDSLLRYKLGFSERTASLYSYHRVHNEGNYRRLCALKLAHETAQGIMSESDYFPLYRR